MLEGGWIKVRKALKDDLRVWGMAKALGERDQAAGRVAPPFERLWITCAGAVCILWIIADSQIDQNDILALGPADIDRITGIQGFCEIMPAKWLQVIDANHVKLPNFQTHNGPAAKKRALATGRKHRHRDKVAFLKRGHERGQ